MLTIDYIDVLNGACDLCGLPRYGAGLSAQDNAKLQAFIGKRLAQAARYHFWPDYLRNEERWFRLNYDAATAYAAPTSSAASEVFYPPTQVYYQALRATTGNAPATLSSGTYTTNAAYWAVTAGSYSAADWANATAYAVGNQVRSPANNLFYQCHTAHTSSGSLDTSKFGILTVFDRYVGFSQTGYTALGDVLEVWNTNPRVHRSAVELDFELSQNGVQIADAATSVWMRYRIRVPRLSGATYSATATYAVGNQTYFSSTATAGNFYDCVTATSAGESPDTAAAKWSVVQIPRIFEMYLKWGAYADWLVGDGQNDKGGIEDRRAESWLGREANIFMQQEQQRRPVRVLSR